MSSSLINSNSPELHLFHVLTRDSYTYPQTVLFCPLAACNESFSLEKKPDLFWFIVVMPLLSRA